MKVAGLGFPNRESKHRFAARSASLPPAGACRLDAFWRPPDDKADAPVLISLGARNSA